MVIPSNAPEIFSPAARLQKLERSRPHFTNHNFLHERITQDLIERLHMITRDFDQAVLLGDLTPKEAFLQTGKIQNLHTVHESKHSVPVIIASSEILPFRTHSLDLVISCLNLHVINDLPGTLIQIRRALKPDGLFLCAFFGGETLHELRASLNEAEITCRGGISPRIHPMIDKQQAGALMQRASFALPVIDSDIIPVNYSKLESLYADLRGMGETNTLLARSKTFTPRRLFEKTQEIYARDHMSYDGYYQASFEIIYCLGWGPSDTQQKPLAPGSAQRHLSEIL